MSQSDIKISKFLSYVLRHNPGAIDLEPDDYGWASIETLLDNAGQRHPDLDFEKLVTVVQNDRKNRFTISPDGLYIRANYGHSVDVILPDEEEEPPNTLYHGTAQQSVDAILREGIKPQSRQYVHLSVTVDDARQVGMRHGKPVILAIDAGAMHRDGYTFYPTKSDVWLTEQVPARYLHVSTDRKL